MRTRKELRSSESDWIRTCKTSRAPARTEAPTRTRKPKRTKPLWKRVFA